MTNANLNGHRGRMSFVESDVQMGNWYKRACRGCGRLRKGTTGEKEESRWVKEKNELEDDLEQQEEMEEWLGVVRHVLA